MERLIQENKKKKEDARKRKEERRKKMDLSSREGGRLRFGLERLKGRKAKRTKTNAAAEE